MQNGEVIVRPSIDMIRAGSKRWNTTAVGYFLGKKPYFHHLNEFVRSIWPGVRDVKATSNGFFFFQFNSVADMEEVIEGGPWLYLGQPIVLKSGTGLDFARVCVMLHISSKLPKHVVIMMPNELGGESACKVDVEYEWLPPKCTGCSSLGHSVKECPLSKPMKPAVSLYVRKSMPPKQAAPELKMSEQSQVDPSRKKNQPEIEDNGAFWNVRGLNRRDHQVAVRDLVNEFRLHFIALLETRVLHSNATRIQSGVLYRWRWFVDYAGPGNRIWIAWNDELIDVDILNVDTQYVHCRVHFNELHETILITVVYGANDVSTRRDLWQGLIELADTVDNEPWLVGGDFNAVLDMSEVSGASGDIRGAMNEFNDCILQTGLLLFLCKVSLFRFDNYLALSPGFLESVHSIWRHPIVGTRMYSVTRKLKALKSVSDNKEGYAATESEDAVAERFVGGDRTDRAMDLQYLRPWARHILTDEEARTIIRPVTIDEVKTAFFDIEEDKAPGPDGFSSGFFKAAWPVVGDEVSNAIRDFFKTGRLLKQLNATLLTLIPKVRNPQSVAEFRPISCCNVIYKAITKILVSRIREILDLLISPSQNAFVPGRLISDNILLAQELFSGYNQCRLPPRCALKVDLRKAYDTVEWDFLFATLRMFGFPAVFIGWIKECVTSAHYSVVVNGVLHMILQQFIEQDGEFSFGIRDSLLTTLGFQEGHLPVRYLGLPLISARLSITDCQALLQKIDSRIKGWEGVQLSFAGRVQLIKSVLTSFEVYWAMAFILPKGIIKEMIKRLRTFLWKGTSSSGYPKVAWEAVCRPIEEGGLGIKDILAINRALMSKHLWAVIKQDRTSIWVDWITQVRLRDCSIGQLRKTKELGAGGKCYHYDIL
ncbi:UNVERIFIED_CONTAM: hypothetical protein Scaly_3136500 [Sesamum calycinum]|uniref:Reverse transcriptase domain-containing protein n=1 Tax=Sesamum calycinum TaxID=2727403 RepID=A0AAW2JGD8_9LAMI